MGDADAEVRSPLRSGDRIARQKGIADGAGIGSCRPVSDGSRRDLTDKVIAAVQARGFDRCAIASVTPLTASQRLQEWLRRGYHGGMAWMQRDVERRVDPGKIVPEARSVIVVAMDYDTGHTPSEDPRRARISRYAWGEEYHEVLGERLSGLSEDLCELDPGFAGRWYVDTGPVLEKAWAEKAGLGWIGKHTNLLARSAGSWFFLGAVITNVELDPGEAAVDHCGSCSACITICPTQAIVEPYVLDARRCIAYLTIENRGPIPTEFRAPIGNRVFGCDDCQEVCPWNRFAKASRQSQSFAPRRENKAPELISLMCLSEQQFRERFRGSPIRRARYAGFLRNVAVAIGNSGDRQAVPLLLHRLHDAQSLVRGHVAWALGSLGGSEATQGLRERLSVEPDSWVREEIRAALQQRPQGSPSTPTYGTPSPC